VKRRTVDAERAEAFAKIEVEEAGRRVDALRDEAGGDGWDAHTSSGHMIYFPHHSEHLKKGHRCYSVSQSRPRTRHSARV